MGIAKAQHKGAAGGVRIGNRTWYGGLCIILLLLFFGGVPGMGKDQVQPDADEDLKQLFDRIDSRLDTPRQGESYGFILDEVRAHCQKRPGCLFPTYLAVMRQLERRFFISAAIFVCGEMVKVAQARKNRKEEAFAFENLFRFHGALGNHRLALVHIDKALALYEQMGNQEASTRISMLRLEMEIHSKGAEKVLPQMNKLLAKAEANREIQSVEYLHTRLVGHCLSAGRYEEMLQHIVFLEQIPRSNPVKPNEYGIWITAVMGRADLARVQGRLSESESVYRKALSIAEEEPSRWLEIHILHMLAELEWKRGNAALARSWLDKALAKAQNLQVDDLLARTFELKTLIAEAEGRFADALEASRKQAFHEERFEEKSAGFDMENYYLQLEKEQLEGERENAVLQLQLQKVRQRNYLFLVFLFFSLTAGAFWGIFHLRKQKQQLVMQNALIRQQGDQLKQLDSVKSHLFANVSHELRTPLTLILGAMGSLQKGFQGAEQQTQLLKIAGQAGKQLEMLIADILDLRKLELGKMEIREQATALNDFFYNHLALFESLARLRQLEYSYAVEIPSDQVVLLDRAKCRQIVNNLLSNAFKFSPAGGVVQAQLRLEKEMLHLSVSDTGPGIHPDDLPHVFDRFFQSNRPGQQAEGGTGIGLALCKEYATLFGGDITVESTLGEGSTFRVSFPVVQSYDPVLPLSADEGQKPPKAASAAASLEENKDMLISSAGQTAENRPLILVVEDNPGLQEYLKMILSASYEVVVAENGRDALQWLAGNGKQAPEPGNDHPHSAPITNHQPLITNHQPPALILSDLMMPVMDGLQLLEALKSREATWHIPVIILTARADAADKLKALRIGVDDYLLKPFDEEELLARIANLLRNRVHRQEEDA
ncbi:MAG: response regulator, partial [Haliscomenobacter sp.]|nr:response regulator [Haliscomenobacter sp.]